MAFDLPNAILPALTPLAESYAENTTEDELKQIFIDLFSSLLASDAFDCNVLGAAHLGSMVLVRKSVNTDGLSLIFKENEEPAMRYLYRAWKAKDTQGRGLAFISTFLQLLYPGDFTIYQIWHEFVERNIYFGDDERYLDGDWDFKPEIEQKAYPQYTHRRPLGSLDEIPSDQCLTSRIEIDLGATFNPSNADIQAVARILNACLPARVVLTFGCWMDRYFATEDSVDCWYFGADAGYFGDQVYITYNPWMNQ